MLVLRMNSPPVNALGQLLRRVLLEALDAAEANPEIDALVIASNDRGFSAAADVRVFGRPQTTQAPTLGDLIAAIEDCGKPVVAAIQGVCMRGLGHPPAQLAMPEVNLGLIPGAGGTQRRHLGGGGSDLVWIAGGGCGH